MTDLAGIPDHFLSRLFFHERGITTGPPELTKM